MSFNDHFSNQNKLDMASTYATAATSSVTGTGYDCSNYEGIIFYSRFGTAAADNTLKAQQSSDDASTDAYSDLEDSSVEVGASDEQVWLEVRRPVKKWVKPIGLRGTSSTMDPIIAIRYGARSLPVDNTTAGTIHGKVIISPAEGTA